MSGQKVINTHSMSSRKALADRKIRRGPLADLMQIHSLCKVVKQTGMGGCYRDDDGCRGAAPATGGSPAHPKDIVPTPQGFLQPQPAGHKISP